MTDEEVEERFVKNYPEFCTIRNRQPLSPYWDLWEAGVEFAYNKANEWHYVKDGDLPKDFGYYLVALTSIAYKGFVFEVVYFTGSIFTKEGEISDNVYAWKEIVSPSEPMRSLDKEEQKNYTKAINKVYKPTGVKLFDKENG